MKSVLLLGSTGSIGQQTLELVRESAGALRVAGLAAARSAEQLLAQVREFEPPFAALADADAAERVRADWPRGTRLFSGPEAVLELIAAARFDIALHGMVGAAGLLPSLHVLRRGRALALANKESLVVAGAALVEVARQHGAPILPVDSEHCAIHQCLSGRTAAEVRRIYLTASGGPLRDLPLEQLEQATPEQALNHPNWSMGPRITVGSATLMNKALEVIEAHHLFGLAAEQIAVVIHRQSIVHSMVEFVDGSVLAQMGPPDMRGPIHWALHWPERRPSTLKGFDLGLFRALSFEAADARRFPALQLGYDCVERGGSSGAALNAADEVAVAAFLERKIRFGDIARIDADVLKQHSFCSGDATELLAADAQARRLATVRVHSAALAAAR